MNKIEEQICDLKLMYNNKTIKIDEPNYKGFLIKQSNEYIIAIEYNWDKDFMESFVGMKVCTDCLNLDNDSSIKVLCLKAGEAIDISKFAYIGAYFLNLDYRMKLCEDPLEWIDEWKNIFGNSIKKRMVYDVIGELVSLYICYSNDSSTRWMGPSKGSHDIVAKDAVFEVKSSLDKSNTKITIHSAFQIDTKVNEKLLFCRLEPKPYCYSINSLIKSIVKLGYSEEELENNLMLVGYEKGKRERDYSFNILEVLSFDVNESNFPLISIENINKFAPFKNIVNYELVLDLNSVPYQLTHFCNDK